MRKFQSGIAPIIIIIIVVVLGASAIAGGYAISSGRSTKPEGAAAGSRQLSDFQVPAQVPPAGVPGAEHAANPERPSPTPQGAGLVKEESGTTATGWSYSGFRDVIATPSFSADKRYVMVEMERKNFNNVALISCDLKYRDVKNLAHEVRGTIIPANEKIGTKTNGNMYVKEELFLGACSKGVCTDHSGPNTFELTITTTRTGSGQTYQQVLKKASQ